MCGGEGRGGGVATSFDESGASFSPDGHWLCYVSDESGKPELYVTPFPDLTGKRQASKDGAVLGGWVRGGREILYLSPDRDIESAEVRPSSSGIEIGPPRRLFNAAFTGGVWAWTPGGDRFLVAVTPGGAEAPQLALVANWMAGLAEK